MSDRELFEIDYGAGYLRDTPDEQGRIKFRGWLIPAVGVVSLDAIDREPIADILDDFVDRLDHGEAPDDRAFARLVNATADRLIAVLGVEEGDDPRGHHPHCPTDMGGTSCNCAVLRGEEGDDDGN